MASVAIRLGTSGKAQVRADLDEIATSGDAAAKRHARAWLNAANDVETALQRQERAMKKLEMVAPGLNPTKLDQFAGVRDDVGKSAQSSASVFSAAYDQMEARAEALLRRIDPVRDAQARFNATIGEARGLVAAGVMSLDGYADVLRAERAALDEVTRAHSRAGTATSQTGRAFAAASPQIQDFFVQVGLGANPMQAFAVQGGQVAGQLMHLENRAGAVARFMMGPWGLAFQFALMAAAPLVAKLWEETEASKKAREAKEEHRKAVLALADAQGKALQTAERRQALDVAQISIDLQAALATRQRAQAQLEQARAGLLALNQPGLNGERGIGVARREAQGQIDRLTAELANNSSEIARLQKGFDQGFARMIGQRAEADSTPEGAIRRRYDRQIAEAMDTLSGVANAPRLNAKLEELYAARDRELKAIEKSTQARDRDTLTSASVAKLLREELPGVRITSTTGDKHVKNSYHYRNQAVDFVPAGGMSSMTKADVRRIFESRGIEIVELLGPGDKNHSNHFHVAWTKGKLALDAFTDAAKRAQAERKVFEDGARDTSQLLDRFIGGMAGPDIGGFDPANVVQEMDRRRDAKQAIVDSASGIINEQREQVTLLERELQLVGANDNYREAELGKLRLILELNRLNVDLESDRGREILSNAEKLDEMTTRLRRQGRIWDEIRNTGDQIIDRLFDPQSPETWGERMKGVLGDIRNELLKLALINPLKNWLYGDDNPTIGGVLGKLFGVAKGLAPGGAAAPTHSKAIPNAVGTEYFSGGAALVGEFGPEIVSMPRGSRVTTAGETRRLFAGNDNGSASFHFDLRGAVMTEDLLAQMNAIGNGAAMRGAAGGAQLAQSQRSRAVRRRLPGQ